MIAYLSGKVIDIKINYLVVMVGGIGYKIFVTAQTIAKTKENQKINLEIYQHIRENEISLYGFASSEEKELFELLISVSGIGPKGALAILSKTDPKEIKKAIVSNNPEFFTFVSGIGSKMANRIILELKNKVSSDGEIVIAENYSEVVEALDELGYHRSEIKKIINKIPRNLTEAEKIKWALRELGK